MTECDCQFGGIILKTDNSTNLPWYVFEEGIIVAKSGFRCRFFDIERWGLNYRRGTFDACLGTNLLSRDTGLLDRLADFIGTGNTRCLPIILMIGRWGCSIIIMILLLLPRTESAFQRWKSHFSKNEEPRIGKVPRNAQFRNTMTESRLVPIYRLTKDRGTSHTATKRPRCTKESNHRYCTIFFPSVACKSYQILDYKPNIMSVYHVCGSNVRSNLCYSWNDRGKQPTRASSKPGGGSSEKNNISKSIFFLDAENRLLRVDDTTGRFYSFICRW